MRTIAHPNVNVPTSSDWLAYIDLGFPFMFVRQPLFSPLTKEEQARQEAERLAAEKEAAEREIRRQFENAQTLLRQLLEKDKNKFVLQPQQSALLNFNTQFDEAKATLKTIVDQQIKLVQSLLEESPDFSDLQKNQLKILVATLHTTLVQQIEALKPEEPEVFAQVAKAAFRGLHVSERAIKGEKQGRWSREENLQVLCAILCGLLGAVGVLLGPVGLVLGVLIGILLGRGLGTGIFLATTSQDELLREELSSQAETFRSNNGTGVGLFKPSKPSQSAEDAEAVMMVTLKP